MTANNGTGNLSSKNQTVLSDTLMFGMLQAVKHANGRDWWIVCHRRQSNTFYKCLLSPAGISNIQSENEGPLFTNGMYYFRGQTVFSPDGSQYAIARHDTNQVSLLDFDRCMWRVLLQSNH